MHAYRMQLLIHAESSDPALQLLLKVTDLLASCSEGENLFIESICQNVLGISELLKVITLNTNLSIIVDNYCYRFYLLINLIQFEKSLLYDFCFGYI